MLDKCSNKLPRAVIQAPSLDIFKTLLSQATQTDSYCENWFGADDLQGLFLPTFIILWLINSPTQGYVLDVLTSFLHLPCWFSSKLLEKHLMNSSHQSCRFTHQNFFLLLTMQAAHSAMNSFWSPGSYTTLYQTQEKSTLPNHTTAFMCSYSNDSSYPLPTHHKLLLHKKHTCRKA